MESQMIHHSALSFRKLRSMKITDRLSCSVTVLRTDLASPALLSQPQFFGQFGLVRSIRLLQDKSPCQIYVRFGSETSAVAAVAWCNAECSLFADAKHGYQKYCVKFINNQKCTKNSCPNRHAWCDTKDIRTFARTRCDGSDVTVSGNCLSSMSMTGMTGMTAPMPMQSQTSTADQQRFQSVMAETQMQSAFINQLLGTIKALRDQNATLKIEMTQLTRNHQTLLMQQTMQRLQTLQQQQQQQQRQQQPQLQMQPQMQVQVQHVQPEVAAEWIEWDALPDIVDEAIKATRIDCGSIHGSMYSNRSGSATPERIMYSSD